MCRVFDSVYGTDWHKPGRSHGAWPITPDGSQLVRDLREKLALTAWGNIPYFTRLFNCKQA